MSGATFTVIVIVLPALGIILVIPLMCYCDDLARKGLLSAITKMMQQPAMAGEMISEDVLLINDNVPVVPYEPVVNYEPVVSYEPVPNYEPVVTYEELFPALPHFSAPPQRSAAPQVPNKLRVGPSLYTQVFTVPKEERKLDHSDTFGEGESLRTCQNITKDTGAHIEISTSKDGSLTFLLTGKHDAVLDARRKILTHFQMQAIKQLSIPKEHHRMILGKKGERLRELEKVTATKINIPSIAENSQIITITGTKEGIEKAEHDIRVSSEEQSRKAFERITVPKIYHPFIVGPNSETSAALAAETGAAIHIPPQSSPNEEIVIAGEKEGVLAAKAKIEEIHRQMEKKCSTVRVEVPKSQHKYVIGTRGATIQEILKETGVYVEIPPPDSPNGTITLRGPHDKLGLALTKVCDKANSVKTATVDAPTWIHKYIIGKKGAEIKSLTQDFPKVHVEFVHSEDKIKIDGPPEEVEGTAAKLDAYVRQLCASITFAELTVNSKYFKHIIGKSGANINRLKDETGVIINIIENELNSIIRIEGNHAGVATAQKDIGDLVEKLENEREKEIFIDQRLIKALRTKGDKIRELREKFERVVIVLPDHTQKRSPVRLRGPHEDVERCEKYVQRLFKEIAETSYVEEVPVAKQFHKYLIGKGGQTSKKIREETQTRLDFPSEEEDSDIITVTGKRENVEEAVKRILAIYKENANVVTEEVAIPPKYYNSLIGTGGKLIQSIMEDCGGVKVKFPSAESASDKVTISGLAEDVEKAKSQLLAHATEQREQSAHSADVRARPELHKFLIGKKGANIKKIKEQTGARIIFPKESDEDQELISIIGRQEAVELAKEQLEAAIKEIDNVSTGETEVAARHHRHFVARRGEVLRRISDECGGVQISFPRQGVASERVTLKGPAECIEVAKQRIAEIVEELEAKVSIECVIPQRHHRTVMGAKGSKVQDITRDHDVQIKFPERNLGYSDAEAPQNGESGEPNEESQEPPVPQNNPADVIRITGRPENCEAAKNALLAHVPLTEDVFLPHDLHNYFVNGQRRRDFMSRYDVHIQLPPSEENSDYIQLTGSPSNLQGAKEYLTEKCEEMEKDKEDRILRSFEVKFHLNPEYIPKVIGKGGVVITKIRQEFDVQINLPKKGESEEDNLISIQGYEESALAAKEAILKIVGDLTQEDVEIDSRVHSRLIGIRGRNVRKIMDEFKVDIRFRRDADNPNIVSISGDREHVLDAKDHLLNLAEEFMQDVDDTHEYRAPAVSSLGSLLAPTEVEPPAQQEWSAPAPQGPARAPPARHHAPDTASTQDFPTFIRTTHTSAPVAAWGPRR